MSLRDRWQQWQAWRARRYLSAHPDIAMGVLRRNEDLAVATLEASHARNGYNAPNAATLLRFDLEAQKGAPQRDTAAYPALTSLGFGGTRPLQRTLPKLSSWNLRRFSEIPPARRAINAITNPILDMPWVIQVRPKVGKKRHEQPEPTSDQQARIEAATAMLERPNNEQTWRELLEMSIEDMTVLGAASIEVQPNHSDERPLFLWPVDTQSIRINAQWQPGDSIFRYSQARGVFYSAMGTTDDVRLQDDELMYIRLNPRTSSPFGYGYLEVAFEVVNSFIGAMEYATRRASNSTPSFAIFLGENTTPDQVRRFQHYWQNEVEGYGSVPLLGGGKAPSVLSMAGAGEDALWLKWQEWLVRIVAMSFGISPMRLGLERDINRCYSADTEILTMAGWKTHDALTDDDFVAVVDPITHEIIYQKPKHIYRYVYEGNMVAAKNSLTDFLVTPNHRMYVGRIEGHGAYGQMQFCEAETLQTMKPQFYELKAVSGVSDVAQNAELQYVTVPDVAVNSYRNYKSRAGFTVDADTFLEFLGYFISEGSVHIGKRPVGTYRVQLCQKDGPTAERMRMVLQAMPCRFEEHIHAPTSMVLWKKQHKPLCMYLAQECGVGAENKRIPSWVKLLPARQLRIIFDALMLGDGTWRITKAWHHGFYTTASKQLADDVQEIAFKLGYRTQIAIHKDALHDSNPRRLPLYRIMVSKRKHAMYYAKNVTYVPYSGTVWCVEVPPYGLFVTRRNGKISIHGNSTAEAQATGDWETVAPVANAIKNHITHWLLWRRLKWTDLEFGWQVKIADELQLATILEKQYGMNSIKVDELREVYERPPLDNGLGDLTKTAYEAAINGAVAQQELSQEQAHEERMAKQAPKVVPRQVAAADEDAADAWLRALVREQRELAAVAT